MAKQHTKMFQFLNTHQKNKKINHSNGNQSLIYSMLQSLLNIKEMPKHLDTDGLTRMHYLQDHQKYEENYSSWSSF